MLHTNLALSIPAVHLSTIADLCLDVHQAVLHILPTQVDVASIQPVVVNRDGVFLVENNMLCHIHDIEAHSKE